MTLGSGSFFGAPQRGSFFGSSQGCDRDAWGRPQPDVARAIARSFARLNNNGNPVGAVQFNGDGSHSLTKIDASGRVIVGQTIPAPIHPLTGRQLEAFKSYRAKLIRRIDNIPSGAEITVEVMPAFVMYLKSNGLVFWTEGVAGRDFDWL